MNNQQEILHTIALTQVPLIGNITAHRLIAACGNAENVFKESAKNLSLIEHVSAAIANSVVSAKNRAIEIACREMKFIEDNQITVFLKSDDTYPKRLLQCIDAPIVLYGRGRLNLNPK